MTGRFSIGVIGASRIAPAAIIAPARATGVAEIAVVAARDGARATEFARAHSIESAVTGYETLFQHPGIHAVYNGLPVSRHAEVSLQALDAGLHVLCEKPFAMNAGEARAMVDCARAKGLILMEAFHYRYHPVFQRALDAVRTGEIGTLRQIEARFHAEIPARADEIRFDPLLGGGALMDLGAYCVHWCRTIASAEPTVRRAEHRLGKTGADLATLVDLAFPGDVQAMLSCDMEAPFEATLKVIGTAGSITLTNPLVPQYGHAIRFDVNGRQWTETLTKTPTYDFQLRAFVDAVRTGKEPLTGGADAVAQMIALDAIRHASVPV